MDKEQILIKTRAIDNAEWGAFLNEIADLVKLSIPETPHNVDNRWFTCPNCGHGFSGMEHGEPNEVNFCIKCGQAIRW